MRDSFVDLTPNFQKDGMDVKDYYPAIMNLFSPGGKIYAIPSDWRPSAWSITTGISSMRPRSPIPPPSGNGLRISWPSARNS